MYFKAFLLITLAVSMAAAAPVRAAGKGKVQTKKAQKQLLYRPSSTFGRWPYQEV